MFGVRHICFNFFFLASEFPCSYLNFSMILSKIGRYEIAWKGQICDVVVFIVNFFFGLLWNAQCFLIFLWILMQIRNVNFLSVHLLFMVAGWKNVKSVSKMCETHFQNIITYFEQVFVSWIRSLKIDWNSANITWLNT